MSETRSGGARKRAKAKARAAAAVPSPGPKVKAAPAAENAAAVPVEATPATTKSGGKKAKKGKATTAETAPPPAPPSPSPQKKKKRKRIHKRKGSVAEVYAEATPTEPTEPATKSKAKAKQETSTKPSVKRGKAVKATGSAQPTTSETAPVAKRTRKRKNRSGSIGAQQEEEAELTTKMDDRKVVNLTPKKQPRQPAAEQTPTGRTTRAALAAAAAGAATAPETASVPTPTDEDAPATTSISKKRRKSKAAGAVLTETAAEPVPEPEVKAPKVETQAPEPNTKAPDAESKPPGPQTPLRKSARLANEDATPAKQLLPTRPVRKIISFAKVKGTTPKEISEVETRIQQLDSEDSHSIATEDEGEVQSTPSPSAVQQDAVKKTPQVKMVPDPILPKKSYTSPSTAHGESPVKEEKKAGTASTAPVAEKLPTPPSVSAVAQETVVEEVTESDMQSSPLESEEDEDASVEAILSGELASLADADRTSSVETMADDESYQGDVLNEENARADANSTSSDLEDKSSVRGETYAPPAATSRNELSVQGTELDEETKSVGSSTGSEALALEGAEEDDDAEYESLGVDNASQDEDEEMRNAIDLDEEEEDDELDDRDETATTPLAADLLASSSSLAHYTGEQYQSEDEEDDDQFNDSQNAEPERGLNDSFLEEEESDSQVTDSDDDDGLANQADTTDTTGMDEWPGVRPTQSNRPLSNDELIVLSDTDSDEDAESTGQHGQSIGSDDEGHDEESGAHSDTGIHADPDPANHQGRTIDDEASRILMGDSDEDAAEHAARYDEGETMEHDGEDAPSNAAHSEHESLEHEDLSEDEERAQLEEELTSVDFHGTSHESQSANHEQLLEEHAGLFDENVESANESDGTIELPDKCDEDQRDDISSQGDEVDALSHEDGTDEGEEVQNGEVERALLTAQVSAPHATASASPREESRIVTEHTGADAPHSSIPSDTAMTSAKIEQASRAVAPDVASSATTAITYSTTPSKHLIESVFSSSREQTLASITREALATPIHPPRRSRERAWGPSFGMRAPLDTSSATTDVPSQAAASPLSSWFFSRGPANFKKRVLIPSPGSPRQRVGSPRPLKMMRVEATDLAQANNDLLDQPESGVDRFVQGLLDKSAWRSWYTKTQPDQLLDPPLPAEMIKRLGGDTALAMFSQASVTMPPSPLSVEPSRNSITIPKKRRRALAELEASIQEEKKRTKAFDKELLLLLQGKTLSGKELTEEFAPLLPPVVQNKP